MRPQLNKDFWQGKRILITGHTGFKGGWLSLWLQSMGSVVRGVALEPEAQPSLFDVASIEHGMEHIILDIREYDKLKECVSEFRPEIIIHAAAQPLVRLSYEKPIETYETNIMGTINVLEVARKCGSVKAIINVTTDKCYENHEWVWGYRENEPMGGYDPYSSSKGCAELVSSAYRRSFLQSEGIALATVRAGNVIGGGDWAVDRLVPDILRAVEKNEPVLVRNPQAVRPWQHVLEPLSGYLLLAERLFLEGQSYAEAWNFGPSDQDARSVQWIVEHLCKMWSSEAKWETQPGTHPHEAGYLKLDISKARRHLSWEPRLSLDVCLEFITRWHKAWLSGQDMRQVSLNQIDEYCAQI